MGEHEPGRDVARLRVLVVARARLHREGLALLLGQVPQVAVIDVASGTDPGHAVAGTRPPDAVLVEVRDLDGDLDLLRRVVAAADGAKVVALGSAHDRDLVVACAEAGVAGYADIDAPVARLVAALESVRRDELACTPALGSMLLRQLGALARGAPAAAPPARLTARELEILRLVDEGLSNKQIAARLQIELATVKNHVHHILEKLRVAGRGAAAARARALGLTA